MAIALVTNNGVLINAAGSESFGLTVSGANTYLVVAINVRHGAGASPISAVTWNGSAMTQVLAFIGVSGLNFVELWGMVAPAAGAHSVVITSDGSSYGYATGSLWSGVDQSTPAPHTATYSNAFTSSPTNTAITVDSGGYAIDATMIGGSPVPSSIVVQNSATALVATNDFWGCEGHAYKLNATQMGWAWTSGGGTWDYTQAIISLLPASTATVPDAPTMGTASAGNGQATVGASSNSDGGSPLTTPKHTVTSTPGGIVGTGDTWPVTVTGLTNGVAYTFKAKDHNAISTGYSAESSASNSVTPQAGLFQTAMRVNL